MEVHEAIDSFHGFFIFEVVRRAEFFHLRLNLVERFPFGAADDAGEAGLVEDEEDKERQPEKYK